MSMQMANFGHSGIGAIATQDLSPVRKLITALLANGGTKKRQLLRYFATEFQVDCVNAVIRKVL
jgi:hypothetical protein